MKTENRCPVCNHLLSWNEDFGRYGGSGGQNSPCQCILELANLRARLQAIQKDFCPEIAKAIQERFSDILMD